MTREQLDRAVKLNEEMRELELFRDKLIEKRVAVCFYNGQYWPVVTGKGQTGKIMDAILSYARVVVDAGIDNCVKELENL